MTAKELEHNCATLSEPRTKIAHIQHVAALGHVPIPNITVLTLTLAMLESTGLLATTTTQKCRLRPINEWTLDLFLKSKLKLGIQQERVRKLTAASEVGYHGTHQQATSRFATPLPTTAVAVVTPAPTAPPVHVSVDGGKMYFCWTNGLGTHRNHTSATCNHKADGH